MRRLIELPGTRRGKWIVLAVWFVLMAVFMGLNLPGKFQDAEKNDSASFLPGDVESTHALDITKKLRGGDTAATVVVYHRDGRLTRADEAQISGDLAKLNRLDFRNTTDFVRGERSKDGSTALLVNTIKGNGKSENLTDPIDAYREVAEAATKDGLTAQVGGPAGISADAVKVFESINGTLLLAAVSLVFFLLILIYRSPFFWFFPMLAVVVSELTARSAGYGLTQLGTTVNGQSSSILSVLVLGAGTDYALLLVARYREELRTHEDKHEAMQLALRRAGPAIIASGLTVAATLMSLTLAKVNGTAGLGPTGALAIVVALLAQLTLLPALLTAVGRKPFWPFVPHFGDEGNDETHGVWRRLGERIATNPRRVWMTTGLLLLVFAGGLLNFSDGLTQSNSFRDEPDSLKAQQTVAKAYPAGASAPGDILVRTPGREAAVKHFVEEAPGVAAVFPSGERGNGVTVLSVVFKDDPYSTKAYDRVPGIREAARRGDPKALVGGPTAVEVDLRDASARDTKLLVPLALVIVFVILLLLLRAVTAPLLLIGTVILSFLSSLGVAAVVYDVVFGFPGADPSLPLFAFIFLVALGVDYNIFLMARVREETREFGTRPGMIRGLAVTGGVITSAGIVLAGTFMVLAALPLTFLTEIGFVIAFGVLLDTFVVRSILVPALVLDLGPRIWWPSALALEEDHAEREDIVRGPSATD